MENILSFGVLVTGIEQKTAEADVLRKYESRDKEALLILTLSVTEPMIKLFRNVKYANVTWTKLNIFEI